MSTKFNIKINVLFVIQAMKVAILFLDGVNIGKSYLSHDQ
jgi:hypothetical protein